MEPRCVLLYRVAQREEGLSPSAAGTPNAVGDVSPSPFETSVAGVRMRETSPVSAPARRDGGPLPTAGVPPRTSGRASQGSCGRGRRRALLLESATDPLPPRQTSGADLDDVLSDPVELDTNMADVDGDRPEKVSVNVVWLAVSGRV